MGKATYNVDFLNGLHAFLMTSSEVRNDGSASAILCRLMTTLLISNSTRGALEDRDLGDILRPYRTLRRTLNSSEFRCIWLRLADLYYRTGNDVIASCLRTGLINCLESGEIRLA